MGRILRVFPRKHHTLSREGQKSQVERRYLRYAGVGIQFGLSIFLLTAFGAWLDRRVGSAPLFTVLFLLLGFAGATISLVRQVLGPGDKRRK